MRSNRLWRAVRALETALRASALSRVQASVRLVLGELLVPRQAAAIAAVERTWAETVAALLREVAATDTPNWRTVCFRQGRMPL